MEGEEGAGTGVLSFTVLELQRVRAMISSVGQLTAVAPKGCVVPDAHNRLVPNKLFSGERRAPVCAPVCAGSAPGRAQRCLSWHAPSPAPSVVWERLQQGIMTGHS